MSCTGVARKLCFTQHEMPKAALKYLTSATVVQKVFKMTTKWPKGVKRWPIHAELEVGDLRRVNRYKIAPIEERLKKFQIRVLLTIFTLIDVHAGTSLGLSLCAL